MIPAVGPRMAAAGLADSTCELRIGFVLHVMQVAGAEVLVAETIRRLRATIVPTVLCLDGVGALGERMQTEGVDVIALSRRPGLDFSVARRMAKVIRARRLQVLHAHQYTPFFYGALAARLANIGTRVIFTEHGRHYPDVISWKRRLANRVVFDRLADRITGVCDFSARGLAEHDGFSRSRIEVIENGIDLARYQTPVDRKALRLRLRLDPARRYVASVARLHPVKDHRTLLEAFSHVAQIASDVDLLLVGDGPLRSELEQQASALGIASRVCFTGLRDDVPDILAAIDVFTLSSLSEAASITLLEAMAAGVPVVVTDVGGNGEIIRDGLDGLLTPRGDARALADALTKVLSNRPFAVSLGRSGAERVSSRYQLNRTIERYLKMYQQLAGSDGRRG